MFQTTALRSPRSAATLAIATALCLSACKSSDDDSGGGGSAGSGSDGSVSFAVSGTSVLESSGALSIELQLSQVAPADVRVNLLAGGTASASEDYSLLTSFVEIPAGQLTGIASLTVLEDTLFEVDETAELSISSVESAADVIAGSLPQFQVTVQDNDVAPIVEFAESSATGTETDLEIRLPVGLSAIAGVDIVVPLTYGGTAGAMDYELPPATVTIPGGQIQADVVLRPLPDALDEGAEEILVMLGTPDLASLGSVVEATVTLLDGEDGVPWGPFVIRARDLGANQLGFHTVQLEESSATPITPPNLGVFAAEDAYALSPLGDRLAYRAFDSQTSTTSVYVSSAIGSPPLPISGPENAGMGNWSPDGEYLAIWDSLPGDTPRRLNTVRRDGMELTTILPGGLQLPDNESSETARWSADSQQIAYRAHPADSTPVRLYRSNRDGSAMTEVSANLDASLDIDDTYQWSPTGDMLAFSAAGSLWVQVSAGADPVLVASVLVGPSANDFQFQWSPDGAALAYLGFDEVDEDPSILVWQPTGATVEVTGQGFSVGQWSWAPDGSRLAYLQKLGEFSRYSLYTVLPDGTGNEQITDDVETFDFRWSPNGVHLAYRIRVGSFPRLFTCEADGSGSRIISLFGDLFDLVPDLASYRWAPDSTRVSYVATRVDTEIGEPVLASNLVDGSDLLDHKGPIFMAGDVIAEHRWTQDSQHIAAIILDLPGPTSTVRYWPRSGSAPETNASMNLASGNASISDLETR